MGNCKEIERDLLKFQRIPRSHNTQMDKMSTVASIYNPLDRVRDNEPVELLTKPSYKVDMEVLVGNIEQAFS